MDWELWNQGLWALVPTITVGAIFWFVMRALIRSDRNERRAYDRIEARERERRGLPPRDAS
ncbi:hypothetical protein C5C36_07565 [Rathayibacter sp. AY1G1]|jgi:hypothetical protein|uniref:hypothetical protein n=1 Tax=unclassified Rathayibacter TaxID=2609250 RepID=UPI000CE760CA|nr:MULTISPECIES: hypothetical protein [unclassified Rathayibacter]PPF13254.1 hypothetical protein C5B98_02400 [Rathayibacter sp. AY1A5]PPF17266.1 hypothetical protein C5B92_09450 [Rathayibacter sp. AY1A4]PPF22027.1 hypothetical protein C5B95_03225 [Rathayibacter sp. AY1A7]PPF29761.1 hypothetical protein C5C54_02800 [Rathayibacter sp. AY1F2]PPF30936.1 hypothetical protein C5C10_15155 [Rathayibacter sp. AY1A3]